MPRPRKRSLQAQIGEVRREITLRHKSYPLLVANRKMKEAEAAEHIAIIEAVLDTLQDLHMQETAGKELPK
jgi:hypothetical protein